MAEITTAPEPAKTEEPKVPVLMTEEPKAPPSKESTLFKTAPTVDEAKAAAIKELEDKAVADKAAAQKAATEPKPPTEKAPTATDKKEPASTQTEYTLDLPENSALTKEDLDVTLKEAKAAGLSAEEAKELLQTKDQVAKTAQTRLQQKQEQDLKTMVEGWREAVNKDPEMGGEKLAETAIKGSRALKAIASPAMQDFLLKTGYIHHPEMVRMMTKVYDLIGEDKFVQGSIHAQPSVPQTMEEKARKLFGTPIKETV